MESNQHGGNVNEISADPLELARHFAGPGVRVPVEIVEENGETVVLDEGRDDHHPEGSSETIEVTVEEMPSSYTQTTMDSTQLTSSKQPADCDITPTIDSNNTQEAPSSAVNSLNSALGLTAFDNNNSIDPQITLQQMSQHFQEVSRQLRNEGMEISPETIASHFPPSLAETLAASIINQSTSTSSTTILDSGTAAAQGLQLGGISYNDLADVTRVMNATLDPSLTVSSSAASLPPPSSSSSEIMSGVFNESDIMPSSPESNFDTNELLSLHQDEEVATKLANAGPVGVAAAAAILSGRKRKSYTFETNPAVRKRLSSKLTRRLKETLDELSTRVGLQACAVTYCPSSKQDKPEALYKVYGTSPLCSCLEDQKSRVLGLMDTHLKKHTPKTPKELTQYDLPPLVFDGIPTPVPEMTQAQLRAFIPLMLKYSTGRGKPGWGKKDMKPEWWPIEVPWQNIRSDVREEEQKKAVSWSDCLRRIVLSCYLYHNRADLLPTSTTNNTEKQNGLELHNVVQQPATSEDPAQQLQLLQQQHGLDLSALQSVASAQESSNGTITTLGEITGGEVDNSLLPDQQQVFTIDTGMGNCDTAGMPTLADASLAETAAKLQQVADDTGQVQYATQTVTVTENDAKALGQPVGSTTTVLLTAYPSQGGAESMESQQSTYFPSDPL